MVELLVAASIATVVLLGVGMFYWEMTRSFAFSSAQMALQRQGILVLQEITRVVEPSSGILAGTCGPNTASASVPVQVPSAVLPDPALGKAPALSDGGFVCFFEDGGGIRECRFTSAANRICYEGSTRDLLQGQPGPDAMRSVVPSDMPNAVTFTLVGNRALDVIFNLQTVQGGAVTAGPLRFATRIAVKN